MVIQRTGRDKLLVHEVDRRREEADGGVIRQQLDGGLHAEKVE
jgi:hypothetical protein